jgi:hypothetical protein
MRIARKLTLIAFAVVAAMAFAASSASAQAVEVQQEGGPHCPAVTSPTSGGCHLSAVSDDVISLEAFGSLVSACNNDYEARIDEDGHGYLTDQNLTGPSCTTPPCVTNGVKNPWEIEVYEDAGTKLEARFCVESSALGTVNCHINDVEVDASDHSLARFHLDALPCESPLGFIHVTGEYSATSETGDLEIVHL